jgi:hypothetical protein
MIDNQVVTPQVSTAAGFAYTSTERLADGSHSLVAQAYDQACAELRRSIGNQTQTGPWSFEIVDNAAPSLGVTQYYYHGSP